jgi:hypothetical protein
VTPLERHCRWLLRAYPIWYRRERAGEMLGTLLEASPPGRRWPSLRDAWSLVIGGLRVRGLLAWCLSILWAGLGAAGAGYDFILSEHVPQAQYIGIPSWVGEPEAIYLAAELGALAWLLLTIPVLFAGFVRICRRWLRAGASYGGWLVGTSWVGAWCAGIALMFPIANWQPLAPAVWACGKNQGCALAGYRYAVVTWADLALFATWLALGGAMTVMLALTGRRRARWVPDGTATAA